MSSDSEQVPDAATTEVLRYSAMGYLLIDFLLNIRTGYLRRCLHRTR